MTIGENEYQSRKLLVLSRSVATRAIAKQFCAKDCVTVRVGEGAEARANYDAVSRSQLVAHALFSGTISFMDIFKR